MAIEIRTFASGDTDYIAKLNENYAIIKAAIDQLQVMAGAAGSGSAASAGYMMDALFSHADALIGPGAYAPTYSGGLLLVDPGAMYLADLQTVVQWFGVTELNFGGSTAGTYYVVVTGTGLPGKRDTADAGAAWSVLWTGSAFVGTPVRIAPTFFDTTEATAARISSALAGPASPPVPPIEYHTLDDRLEAAEEQIYAAQQAADAALEAASARVRKVGLSLGGDLSLGIKGAIQVDFAGTIIGWSVTADAVGSVSVSVAKKASSAPPAAPAIPDPVTDKISGTAPIVLSTAQSAAVAAAGVSTWTTAVAQWDVLQFSLVSLTTITKATLYLRIEE